MLSNKIIEHLKQQGIYSEKEDEKYKAALINLGVDLNSDFHFSIYILLKLHFLGGIVKCIMYVGSVFIRTI